MNKYQIQRGPFWFTPERPGRFVELGSWPPQRTTLMDILTQKIDRLQDAVDEANQRAIIAVVCAFTWSGRVRCSLGRMTQRYGASYRMRKKPS